MEKINFQDLPSTETPIDSTNLNLIQTYVETEINSVKTNLESQINSIASKLFPVGSIYISVTNTNPSSFLGGTWVAFGQGRTLVGVDTSQSEFNTVQKTGGAKTVTLDIAHIPPHSHVIPNGYLDNQIDADVRASGVGSYLSGMGTSTAITGSGQAHNNLQPYITVYFWRRTA